jgi:hypothetical protein
LVGLFKIKPGSMVGYPYVISEGVTVRFFIQIFIAGGEYEELESFIFPVSRTSNR